MDHEHSHEYMHARGIEHEHTHADGTTHTHAHTHAVAEHTHDCPGAATCDADCAGCDANPRAEVVALMRYMVNHNAAHAAELAQLADRLKGMGDTEAYDQVMKAVSDFEKGNVRLSAVLSALEIPKQ